MLATRVDKILCLLTRTGIRLLQAMPLRWAALLGRFGGEVVFWADRRHRRMAIANLSRCFQHEKTPAEIRALAHENFRRIGENACCAVHTAALGASDLHKVLEVRGPGVASHDDQQNPAPNRLFATGHFGNFELYAWAGHFVGGYRMVTTYRALPQPRLDALLLALRQQSGCAVFERRKQSAELFKMIQQPGLCIGLLTDQHAGRAGVWLPVFGRECSTNPAAVVLAQRHKMPLHTAICFRTALAHWQIEVGEEIPTFLKGARRPVEDVMRDINRAFETAIRRDPANWFWVHRRWKPKPQPETGSKNAPTACAPGDAGARP